MPVIFNGRRLPVSGNIIFNGTRLDFLRFGKTEVWRRYFVILGTGSETAFSFRPWVEEPSTDDYGWINQTSSTNGDVYVDIQAHNTSEGIRILAVGNPIGYNAALVITPFVMPTSQYSRMFVEYRMSQPSEKAIYFGCKTTPDGKDLLTFTPTSNGPSVTRVRWLNSGADTVTVAEMDLSGIQTDQYVFVYLRVQSDTGPAELTVSRIWME